MWHFRAITDPSLMISDKRRNEEQTENHPQGLCRLAGSPHKLAFAAVPRCWSTEAGFLRQLGKYRWAPENPASVEMCNALTKA